MASERVKPMEQVEQRLKRPRLLPVSPAGAVWLSLSQDGVKLTDDSWNSFSSKNAIDMLNSKKQLIEVQKF